MLYITWHPSGLIDPMLMVATLPGELTTVAKHTLFNIPVLGRMLKASGCVPIERPQDSKDAEASRARNAVTLDGLAQRLAEGGQTLIFPEGVSHTGADIRRVRSGAARMLLGAHLKAAEQGLPPPHLIPIGLHYSESQTFRERAAVVVERAMSVPPVPERVEDAEEQDRQDRDWVAAVTQDIEVELQRANLSKTTWNERTMIWKGRSLAYAEKQRLGGENSSAKHMQSPCLVPVDCVLDGNIMPFIAQTIPVNLQISAVSILQSSIAETSRPTMLTQNPTS